jgi:hypothetical protein
VRLSLWSEPYNPSGSVAAPGVERTLSGARLEPSALLVREAVQNSWDAKDPQHWGPVQFSVHGRTLEGGQLGALRAELLHGDPPGIDGFAEQLSGPVRILVVADRGTTGLGGATRADIATSGPTDFVDFVRNVGQPPDKDLGGGTYGFGKSVFYRASLISTIVVHTRCRTATGAEERLIAACLGQPFIEADRRHTGRHWWGVPAGDEVGVDPVRGVEAAELAAMIGLPPFRRGEFGTTVAVVDADLGDEPRNRITAMAEAAAWHCWPKLIPIDADGAADMRFSFRWEDEPVPVPDPDQHPDLREYAEALRQILRQRDRPSAAPGTGVHSIDCHRPRQHLGLIALRTYLQPATPPVAAASPVGPVSHHVALLRHPRLIVNYRPGPESPVPGTAWAGVFLAETKVDRAFAAAEPPSHDAWNWKELPERSWERTFVKVALERVDRAANSFASPPAPGEGGPAVPLGGLSDALGGLFATAPGTGTSILPGISDGRAAEGGRSSRRAGVGAGSGRRHAPVIELVGGGGLRIIDGRRVLVVLFRVHEGIPTGPVLTTADVGVAVNDGGTTEKEAPLASDAPAVLWWMTDDGSVVHDPSLRLDGGDDRVWSVAVTVPDDTAVRVRLAAESSS